MLMYTCTKSGSYENVDIFGMMHSKLNNLWIFTVTGPHCVLAKFDSIIIHSQEDNIVLKTACFGNSMAPFHTYMYSSYSNVYFFTRHNMLL